MDSRSRSNVSCLNAAVRTALRPRAVAGLLALTSAVASAEPFPAEFELSSLLPANGGDGSQGTVLAGHDEAFSLGASLAVVGDVNGDGIGDVLVGDYQADVPPVDNSGVAWLLFGRSTPFPAVISLGSFLPANGGDGRDGVALVGQAHTFAAEAVGGGGDVNGDGFADVLVGVPSMDRRKKDIGYTHVILGRPTFPPAIGLKTIVDGDGSTAFTVGGIPSRSEAGRALDMVDANGDGLSDLLIGAPRFDPHFNLTDAGEVYLLYGRTDGFDPFVKLADLTPSGGGDGSEGSIFDGRTFRAFAGDAVSRAGDVNGDGFDDFVIGAPVTNSYLGEAFVVFGDEDGYPARLSLHTLHPDGGGTGEKGFVVHHSIGSFVGMIVSAAGDMNGDGLDDVMVAGVSYGWTSFVVLGRTTGFPPLIDLASLDPRHGGDGTDGFLIVAPPEESSPGAAVDAGDVNGDGLDDAAFGFPGADPDGRVNAGRCFVVFGRETAFPPRFDLGDLLAANGGDGTLGFALNGVADNEQVCTALSGGADLNGDGVGDLVAGAPQGSLPPMGSTGPGVAYVVFGRAADRAR
jgi:hypothetical protein